MARRNPQTREKRQREQAKQEKRRAKDARRALRKAEKSKDSGDDTAGETDSDNARSDSLESGPLSDSVI